MCDAPPCGHTIIRCTICKREELQDSPTLELAYEAASRRGWFRFVNVNGALCPYCHGEVKAGLV